MRFVLERQSSSNTIRKIASKVSSRSWHVLDASRGFLTTNFLQKNINYLSFEIPSLKWMHAEHVEETDAVCFYFEQYNSGVREHLMTISADINDTFKINVTKSFEDYLFAAGNVH